MRHLNILPLLIALMTCLSLTSCARKAYYDISTGADVADSGNYVVRWQVRPGMSGEVAIYASDDAGSYPVEPTKVEPIGKEWATFTTDGTVYSRHYFLLVFDDREMRVAGMRVIPTEGFANLRDAGGYMTDEGYQMRWGRLYRGGRYRGLTPRDSLVIGSLGLKHNIVLSDAYSFVYLTNGIGNVVQKDFAANTPIDYKSVLKRINEGDMSKEGVILFIHDTFNSLAYENPEQLSAALHYLLDPDHYPVMISDEWGKDRAAFLTMLVQYSLGVSRSDILSDYLLSNALLPVEKLAPQGFNASPGRQEALSEFFRCRPSDLLSIMTDIENKYGTIGNYMDQVLDFDESDRIRLRELLLY